MILTRLVLVYWWQHEGQTLLHVSTISGQRIPVWVESSDTIGHVKALIQAQTLHPVEQQTIVVSRIGEVSDAKRLCDIFLFEGMQMFLILRPPPARSGSTSLNPNADVSLSATARDSDSGIDINAAGTASP